MWSIKLHPEVSRWMLPRIDLTELEPEFRSEAERFLQGETELTGDRIVLLSDRTHMPYGYFFLDTAPVENDPLLEGWTGYPSRGAVHMLNCMRRRQDAAADVRGYGRAFSRWAAAHAAPDGPPFPDVTSLRDLQRALDEAGVLVMIASTLDGDPSWQLDPHEISAFCLYDNYAPLIYLNSRATGKERLLMREYRVLTWGQDDIVSERKQSPASVTQDLDALLLGIDDGNLPEQEVIPDSYVRLVQRAVQMGIVSYTQATRLLNCGWWEIAAQ